MESSGLRPKRIVHLVTDLRLGGAQRMILARVRGLGMFEHHVWAPARVTAGQGTHLAEELRAAGARLLVGAGGKIGAGGWLLAASAESLRIRPALVHSTLFHTHLVAPFLARMGGSALVVSKEGTDAWMSRAQAREEARIASRAEAVAAVSQAAADAIVALPGKPIAVRVIPNGIAEGPPDWHPCSAPGTEAIVLFVGRLDPWKGIDELIAAAGLLYHSGRAVRLQFQGEGPAGRAIRSAATGPMQCMIQILEPTEARAMPAASRERRVVFVLPSRDEGFGIALLEAMRLGLPVVATRAGGIPELVRDRQDGLLVPPRDPSAIAEAIAQLLDDSELRGRLAESARARSASFTQERMCAAYEALYLDAIEARRRR